MINKILAGFCIIFGAVFSTAGATAFGHSTYSAPTFIGSPETSVDAISEGELQGRSLWMLSTAPMHEQPAWQSLRIKLPALAPHQEAWPGHKGLADNLAVVGSELSNLLTVGPMAMTAGKQVKPEAGRMIPVPEPTTMLLFGAGLIGLAGLARRQYPNA